MSKLVGCPKHATYSLLLTSYCLHSSLALLVLWVLLANNPHDAFALYDLAIVAEFSDRCSDFHYDITSLIAVYNSALR